MIEDIKMISNFEVKYQEKQNSKLEKENFHLFVFEDPVSDRNSNFKKSKIITDKNQNSIDNGSLRNSNGGKIICEH